MLTEEIRKAIHDYHRKGYSYRTIHYLVETEHAYHISFQYLQKKIIPSLGLKRRKGGINVPFEVLLEKSINEINNGLCGSEQLRKTLAIKHDVYIPRSVSRQLCCCLDEAGVARRKQYRLRRRQYISKGPDYAWHMDGYDKLGQFGILIHGCIDGYSRKVIWLKAGITNKRPTVVANYFLQAIAQEGGVPWMIRGDHGSENVDVAAIVRQIHNRESAFKFGKSTYNQRIEKWWGHLRTSRSDYWINRFKLMSEAGVIDMNNVVQKMCLQYCFMPFINTQLEEVKDMWNCHRIRSQKHGDTVSGVPELLHQHGEIHGVNSYTTIVNDQTVNQFLGQYNNNYLALDADFLAVVEELHAQLQLPRPEILDSFDLCHDLFLILSNIMSNITI